MAQEQFTQLKENFERDVNHFIDNLDDRVKKNVPESLSRYLFTQGYLKGLDSMYTIINNEIDTFVEEHV